MKLITKLGFSSIAVAALLAVTGCNAGPTKKIDDKELSYRKSDLLANPTPSGFAYSKAQPGSGKKFKRSFQDAPPLIPHSVDGMLPITQNNNACIGCHMPNVAKSVHATPIPPTHFTNYRPDTKVSNGKIVKEGKVVANTTDVKVAKFKKLNHLYQGRFNCSQCHVPQANIKPLVANKFTPGYKKGGEFKSSLNDDVLEGIE